MSRVTKKGPTVAQERSALEVLAACGYTYAKIRPKSDRFTSLVAIHRKGSKSMTLRPAVSIRLTVPEDTALGQEITKLYRNDESKARGSRRKGKDAHG